MWTHLARCLCRPYSSMLCREVSSWGRMSKPTMSLICCTPKQTSSNLQHTKTDLIKSSTHQNRSYQIFSTPKQTSSNLQHNKNRPCKIFTAPKQTLSNLKHNKDLIKSSTQKNFTYSVHTVHMCACTHMHA